MADGRNINDRLNEVRTRVKNYQHGQKLTQAGALALILELTEVTEWLVEAQGEVDTVMTKLFSQPIMAIPKGHWQEVEKLFSAKEKDEKEEEAPSSMPGHYMNPGQYL